VAGKVRSRGKAILACVIAFSVFATLFMFLGYNATWRLWNVPTMTPHFGDLRVITHGAEAYSRGIDPMVDNIGDPLRRRLNYPRVWQLLYLVGVNQSHTTILGVLIIILFFAGVCLVLPNVHNATILLVFAAVLSPASLVGIERANIDLLMFFIVSMSIVLVQRYPLLSGLAILSGFVLKLYPLFGWTLVLRIEKSKLLRYSITGFLLAAAYTLFTFEDILMIMESTPKGIAFSYGIDVFWMHISSFDAFSGSVVKILSYFLALMLSVFALTALFRRDGLSNKQADTISLDTFRVGAAVYVGTFLLGSNWDYRLIFLVYTIPQLTLWSSERSGVSSIARMMIVMILMSMWYLIFRKLSHYLPIGDYILFAMDEIWNWILYSGMVYLLCWSAPNWVKSDAHKMRKAISG
jgi:hypothetical protein